MIALLDAYGIVGMPKTKATASPLSASFPSTLKPNPTTTPTQAKS
jgi:hypothetical protein